MWGRELLSLATIVTVFVAEPVLAKGQTAATPTGSPGSWVRDEDYPASAVKDQVEGTVGFALTVLADGLPSDCKITSSSGSAILDETTCGLIMKRARFEPARDSSGMAVQGPYMNRVRWVLPMTVPSPPSSNVEVTMVIAADGQVSGCTLVDARGVPAEAVGHLTDPCMVRSYDPYLDEKGHPVARKVTIRTSVIIEPVK